MGRPKIIEAAVDVNVRLPGDVYKCLRDVANEQHVNISTVVREALGDHFKLAKNNIRRLEILDFVFHSNSIGQFNLTEIQRKLEKANRASPRRWAVSRQGSGYIDLHGGWDAVLFQDSYWDVWAKQVVAVCYAMWISPRFSIAVYRVFDRDGQDKQKMLEMFSQMANKDEGQTQ